MMSGVTSSTFYMTILTACLCVWLLAAVTTARPGDSSEASEWATEWQQVADLWKPRDDKDQWRAFEPVKEASTTRWWEGTLDDDLWSQKSQEPSTEKNEDVSSTAFPSVASTKPVPQSEPTNFNASQTATPMVSSSTAIADSDSGQPAFKKGEVNTFVEPDFGNYYRSSGESYGGKVWDSAYSDYYQRKEHTAQDDTKNHNLAHEGKESSVKLEDTNASGKPTISVATYSHEPAVPDVQQDEQDPGIHENRHKSNTPKNSQLRGKDDTSALKESVKQASTNVAGNVSHSGETTVELGKLSEHLAVGEDLSLSSSVVNKSHNLVLTNPEKSDPISGMGVRVIPAQQKPVIKVVEQKDAISRDAIYGKGERLPLPHAGAVNSAVAQNMPTTRKQEEVTTKKASSQFKDWEDWDNSVFDYYDNKDDQDKDDKKENRISNSQEVLSKSSDVKVAKDDTEDDIDDYYDSEEIDDEEDEYEDDDDLDEDEDEYDITDEKHKDTTVLPVNVKKGQIKKSSKSTKGQMLSSPEVEKHADNPDSNKETTSSSEHPNHKPSVKKDLNNPANSKKEENVSVHRKPEDASFAMGSSEKKELNWPHPHPIQLNTESGPLTSPNPPPHDLDHSRQSTRTAAPSTEPTRTSEEISAALENMSKQKSEVNTGFILSFPLEFCKVDSECRAGRTCVIGVCRCFTPSMCAGHHKPVCGSDGFQYSSHCELHRVACVNRIHIRVDRRSKCFQDEIEQKEKIWLMEQQRLMQEKSERQKLLTEKKIQISPSSTYTAHDNSADQAPADLKIGHLAAEEKVSTVTEKTTTPAAVTNDKKECTWKEMSAFKEALLMYYCQKFAEPNCKLEVKTDREYLSMLVFSYCDRDYDYYLTVKELDDKERDEHFTKNIIQNCHLHDFIKYADNLETDGKLTVSEFTSAFEMPVPTPPPHVQIEVIPTLASAGNGLELKCGIDAATIIWKRHGTQLSDDKRSHQLMVFDDGALFFSTVGLHHIGNYTCMDANDESKAQIHRLRVQSMPIVEVMPVVQTHMTGSDIELKCHAEGVPKPAITWKLAGKVLQNSPHTTHYYGGGHIVIHNAKFDTDAGTYTCSAHSQAGTSEKSVAVHVLPPSVTTSKESPKEAGTFVVFHSKGISAYDPLRCLLRHQIPGDFSNFKFIPEALEGPLTLCQKDKDCQWGEAVRVGSEFIYVCQPDQNRVMVMNAGDSWNPLQIIDTDKRPEKLWYVKHLDQVWVLCSSQEHGDSGKTIMVVRDASQHIQHRSVHTQPVGNHFDMVQDLFLAPSNDLEHEFSFGYVSHHGQNGLFKLSLEDMSYTKAIDLTNYGCVPTNIAFVPIGGHVVIQCVSAADQHTLQLVMDYLTDTITSTTSLNGHPMTSPDSRHLVSVDKLTGKVIVTSVSDEGALETTYEVTVSASISDVAFMPAMSHQGYDLVLTSADDDDVIIMNLVTGKVEKIPGSQYLDPTNSWHPSPINRHIISGNSMSNYLMVPSRSSLAILDAKFKQVECEFLDSVNSKVMLYIPSSYTSS